jgi:hypothetical protein
MKFKIRTFSVLFSEQIAAVSLAAFCDRLELIICIYDIAFVSSRLETPCVLKRGRNARELGYCHFGFIVVHVATED